MDDFIPYISNSLYVANRKKFGQRNAKGIFEMFPEQLWIHITKDLAKQIKSNHKNDIFLLSEENRFRIFSFANILLKTNCTSSRIL
jgi:hypothetical protein